MNKIISYFNSYWKNRLEKINDIEIKEYLEDMFLKWRELETKINEYEEEYINYPVYVADFETLTTETNYYKQYGLTKVILWCFRELYNDQSQYYLGTDIKSFIKALKSLNQSMIVYFHNLSFDGDFIIKYLINNGYRLVNEVLGDKLDRSTKQFTIFRNGAKIYKIVLYLRKKINDKIKDIKIVFMCSLNLLSSSVAALGKNYNIKKLEENEDKETFYNVEPQNDILDYNPRFVQYIRNDVDIVRYALRDFEQAIKSLDVVKQYTQYTQKDFKIFNFLTIAALSFKLIKWTLYINNYKLSKYLQIKYDDYKHLKNFFSGGLTQFSPKYQKSKEPLNKTMFIDVNSAYPAIMSGELPYGNLRDKKPDHNNFCEWWTIKIKSIKIKKEFNNIVLFKNWINDVIIKEIIPNSGIHKNKKIKVVNKQRYIKSSKKEFIAYYLKEEFKALLKIYDIEYSIVDKKYQLLAPYLKNHVLNMFELKKEYKANKDPKLLGIKILLNSGYGCLAKRLEYPNFIYTKEQYIKGDILDDKYVVHAVNPTYNIGDLNCYSLMKIDPEYNKVINIGAAAYITAMQRVKLINKILSIPNANNKFVLTDTDSVLFANLTKQDINKLEKSISKEIGEWDVEYKDYNQVSNVSIFGAKKYAIEKEGELMKVRFAGVNNVDFINNPNLELWENDLLEIANASKEIIRDSNGIVLTPKLKVIKRGNL